jgi:acetyl-CoA/propionyl-CoA carboxylase, biotin carboxylase, biotin carboxyl carrier protein
VEIGIPDAFLRLLGPLSATSSSDKKSQENDAGAVIAPVPGLLVHWNVSDGALVEKGEVLAMMDVMKMETAVTASVSGTITILAEAGSSQTAGAVIARIDSGKPSTTEQAKPETRT